MIFDISQRVLIEKTYLLHYNSKPLSYATL